MIKFDHDPTTTNRLLRQPPRAERRNTFEWLEVLKYGVQ